MDEVFIQCEFYAFYMSANELKNFKINTTDADLLTYARRYCRQAAYSFRQANAMLNLLYDYRLLKREDECSSPMRKTKTSFSRLSDLETK